MLELLDQMPELQEDERTIVSSRVFAAPRRMVYEAFADSQQVAAWWGPHGFTTEVLEMDLRAGGVWRLVMQGPDGTRYPNEIVFTQVTPYERVETDLVGGKEGAPRVRLRHTLTWEDEGEGTRFTIRARFESRELRDENARTYGSVQGVRDVMERLERHLAARGGGDGRK